MATTDKITPEAVKAARDAATPGPWRMRRDQDGFTGEIWGPEYTDHEYCLADWVSDANARLVAMAPDLATAYLAQAEEIERLRKRVKAADALVYAGNTLALRLSCIVGREMIVDRWEVAVTQYDHRATEGGA